MKYVSVCVLAAAVALLWAGVARAEREAEYATPGLGPEPRPQPKPPSPPHPGMFAAGSIASAKPMSVEQREERAFLKDAAATSRFQAEASRLALAKSSHAGVRSLATALVTHHATAGIALQHMLHGRGMAPPMLGNDQRKILNRLAKLNGRKFDREYMEEVGLKYLQEDVQLYEKASLAAADPVLKSWIANTLPTLRYHVDAAERTAASDVKLAKGIAARGAAPRPVVVRPSVGNSP